MELQWFYCFVKLGFKLLVRISNKPSNVLHLFFSACVNDMNCRPFLPNYFFLLLVALPEVCYMLILYYLLLTWSCEVCYICCLPPSWCLAVHGRSAYLCSLCTVAAVIACISAFIASISILAIALFTLGCSLAIPFCNLL